ESVAGECPQESVITRTFTATDECGNASTATQVITIVDTTAPVFDEYDAELEMACDDVMETSLTATDNCGEVEITMIEDFDAETGCIGTITRTFTAVDECGNASTAVQVITLIDEVAPVFESFPEDVTVECDQVPSNEGLNVVFSDNCSEVVLEYNGEEIIEGDCANNYTIERTWTITDSCGNSTVATWTINVEDTTAPVFEFVPSDVTYSCDEEIEYSEAAAFDNCSEVSIETAVDTVAGDCPSNFQIVRTFTATDDCGNTSIDTQTITVVDETAPVFTSVPQGNEISCEEELPTEMAMATDNCGEVEVAFNDSIIEGDCPNNYQVVRMWTATDECGNTASAETNYYIYDNTAPEFDGEVEDVVVECADDVPAVADITATDNCGTATVTSSTEVLDEDECGNSVSVVTLTAADECGNTTEISYTVTVEDTTAPELIGAPEDLVLDCDDEVPSAPEVTAVDNCDDNVEVTYTEEFVGEAPAEGSVDDCRTYNPQGVSPAWSLWLQDFENGLDYYELPEGQTGNWVTYPDGSAHLTGTVYSTTQPNRGFEIDVWFENGMDWDSWSSQPFPTSYKDDNGFAEDDMLYEDWTYYIMNSDSATLTGVGDYAGSFLNLSHAPSNLYFGFQEGQAADNRTPDYGIGGWFYYDGFLNGPSFEGEVEGAGDFAFGLDCCPEYEIVRTWTAEDCSGNVTTVSQTISFEDLEEDDPAQDPQLGDSVYEAEKGEIHIGGLAPNPSRNMTYVEYTTKSSQRVVIEVFDLTGHRLDQQSQGLSKAGETYSKQINTSDLESGIYLVKVRSDKGAQTIRLVVSK
ncbi:T9SS type A sorting domain-containing protein, partial [Halocola ammonii]